MENISAIELLRAGITQSVTCWFDLA